jgi:asparagine synthase (glutamine-hydrolysing)
MLVKLDSRESSSWYSANGVYVKGYFFHGGQLFTGNSATVCFVDVKNFADFRRVVQDLNGSFAVVIRLNGQILAAVDRLRSIPLFYSDEKEFVISDSGRAVYDGLVDKEINKDSGEEFVLVGYTIGNETLIRGVHQLQAGQMLQASDGACHASYYYRHEHHAFWSKGEEEYFDNLDEVTGRVFERLVESCAGRPIVVPLSGGYDSRFIAAMLKRRGVEDVICFTYGSEDSFEVEISRNVAKKLGYEWHFVNYTKEKWRDCFDDVDFVEYASNLSSLPNLQDYIAIKELNRDNILPKNAVFIPGYCGDLLGGSYVPYELLIGRWESLKREGLPSFILRKNFGIERKDNAGENLLRRISDNMINSSADEETERFVSANEEFFTRHKVAKYVVNALRSIEYFGYEWRMPLWDNELVEYFYRVPVTDRLHDKLYDRYLHNRVFRKFGLNQKKRPENRIKREFKRLCPDVFLGAAEDSYQFLMRWLRNKRLVDINRFSYLAKICADELNLSGADVKDDVISLYAKWYTVNFLDPDDPKE